MKPPIEFRPKAKTRYPSQKETARSLGESMKAEAVAKRERGGLQNHQEPVRPRPASPLPLSPIPTTAAELKAALVEAGLASEDDFTTTPKFDRVRYQRDYMRDLTKAKKLGITVAEYRSRQKEESK